MAIQRPLKRNSTRRYADLVASEAPLDVDILALEMDDDLDRIYGSVNTILAAAGNPATVWLGLTPPATPIPGQLWWRPDDGNLYVYYDDGTTVQWVAAMASVGSINTGQFYLLAGAVAGGPTGGLSVGFYVAALPFTLPTALAGSQAVAKSAATAQTDFAIFVNGTLRGSIRWAAGGTVATFVWTTSVAIVVGDRIEIVAPGTPDATLADATWTLRGTV